MFYKFTLRLDLLQNDNILPVKISADTLFYEVVIKSNGVVVMRIPFKYEKEWKVELYDSKTAIDVNRMPLSMFPHVGRFNEYPVTFHVAKVVQDVDDGEGETLINNIGYVTDITEYTSEDQDKCFFRLTEGGEYNSFFADSGIFAGTALQEVKELSIDRTKGVFSSKKNRYWYTQRKFYSTTHVTVNDDVHRENLFILVRKFIDKYSTYEFRSLLDMLVKYGKIMTKGRIKYRVDKSFNDNKKMTDYGDQQIERTTRGDCEDFGHFYMRIFRLLVGTYKYLVSPDSYMYSMCEELHDNYVALNYICQVKLSHGLEFHSTMFLVPTNGAFRPISFEVTNPQHSYYLPNGGWNKWHNNSYFLVDNYFICELFDINVNTVSLPDLTFFNY